MNQFKDRRLRALLLCYGVVLLYLLYLHRLPGRAFAGRVNLVPGQTLRTYGRAAWFGLQAPSPGAAALRRRESGGEPSAVFSRRAAAAGALSGAAKVLALFWRPGRVGRSGRGTAVGDGAGRLRY